MIPDTVRAALVVLVAFLLGIAAQLLNLPLSVEVLTALAIALVAKIFGEGETGQSLVRSFMSRG